MELIKIENKELEIKEWNNLRVISVYDIAKLHEREVKRVNEQFKRNKEKFIKNIDYFVITREEMMKSPFATALSKYSNNKEEVLFTESGYLMLVKTFTDDLSWKIQRMLVNSYFKIKEVKEIIKKYEPTEYEQDLLRLEKAKLFKELSDNVRVQSYKDILQSYSANTLANEYILPLPKIEQLSYSATEICKMLLDRYGLKMSIQKLGRIANKENLKIEGNGIWVLDKKKYSEGTTETFRYYEKMVEVFYKLLKGESK
jgi:hypothetical protein